MSRHRYTPAPMPLPPEGIRVTCEINVSMEDLASLPEPQRIAFMKGVALCLLPSSPDPAFPVRG